MRTGRKTVMPWRARGYLIEDAAGDQGEGAARNQARSGVQGRNRVDTLRIHAALQVQLNNTHFAQILMYVQEDCDLNKVESGSGEQLLTDAGVPG